MWPILIGGAVILFAGAAMSRRAKQRAAVAGLRRHFPGIARMRLVAACPGLAEMLDDPMLTNLFDWIMAESYRRSGVGGFGELMRWSVEHGEAQATALVAEVAREAVDRLPEPALAVLDGCGGRVFAGVMLDDALSEAGRRTGPELEKYV
jgi:hypothetical protein